ncbi:hypothetical protein CCM_06449 [Cordyceps militaris CM01]|uniref:Uncharacterized protein n=1 Tax=Cordyceps militaris (strain CM01) TaxID=983644 RepID=G3JME1_CORMM|nr:uncharacterized protein CCM_06449 [Cordyceps militaris CM01]EGX90029.1 hypothetical protein CCM_06449 [Cordyceps militaris CM01]
MANEVKNYFLAPSWDYSPSSQPSDTVCLWNFVSSPTNMVPPLAAATARPTTSDVGETTKQGFEWLRERNKESKIGIWTRFLATLFPGLDVDVGIHGAKTAQNHFTFETMVTKEAYPSDEYLQHMVSQGPVRKYLERFDFKRPVYVVVGTKEVSKANVKHVATRSLGADLRLSADLTMTGTLTSVTSVGPEASTAHSRRDMTGFQDSSDFVFAFRLRKLVIDPQFNISSYDDAKGGVLGDDAENSNRIPIVRLEKTDSTAPAVGGRQEIVEEGNEQVSVTLLI